MEIRQSTLDGFVPWPQEFAKRYVHEGWWKAGTFASLARDVADADRRVAVATRHDTLTYAQLDERADRLAAGLLDIGLRHDDRVVVQLPNTPDIVVCLVAMFRIGVIPVLALPSHRTSELAHLVEQSGAAALVVPDLNQLVDHRDLAEQVRRKVPALRHILVAGEAGPFMSLAEIATDPRDVAGPNPHDVALMLLSGGTTGRPKLIPRTHRDYLLQARETARALDFDASGAYLAALPAAHNAALGCPGVLGALSLGARVVLASAPSPDEVFPLIQEHRVTLTTLMPVFLPVWAEIASSRGIRLPDLTIEVGGAPLDPAVARDAEERLGSTITRWFGISEGVLSFTRPDEPDELRLVTDGTPLLPADEIRVVDDELVDVAQGDPGELLLRGPYTLQGYFGIPRSAEDFTDDGFFRTGDAVRRGPAGHLTYEGRLTAVINRGGEKVPSEEIEAFLELHPGVDVVGVAPIPDSSLGEKICAFIVPADGAAPTLREIREFLAHEGLAEFKRPDRLVLVDHIERTEIGKINRRVLKQRAADLAVRTGKKAMA